MGGDITTDISFDLNCGFEPYTHTHAALRIRVAGLGFVAAIRSCCCLASKHSVIPDVKERVNVNH